MLDFSHTVISKIRFFFFYAAMFSHRAVLGQSNFFTAHAAQIVAVHARVVVIGVFCSTGKITWKYAHNMVICDGLVYRSYGFKEHVHPIQVFRIVRLD